jgi:hypothetical protein
MFGWVLALLVGVVLLAGETTLVASDYGCTTGYGALYSGRANGDNSCSNSFAVSPRTQNWVFVTEVGNPAGPRPWHAISRREAS